MTKKMKNSSRNIVLKWGFFLGVGLSAIELLKFVAHKISYPFGPVFDLMLILLFIAFLLFGIRACRDKAMQGKISFPKAYGRGALISILGCAVFFCYLLFHYDVVQPDGLAKINDNNRQRFYEKLQSDTISTEALTNYFIASDDIIKSEKERVIATIEDSVIATQVSNSIDTLNTYFKLRLNHKTDNDTNFLMKNFDHYARKNWVDAGTQFLNLQENEADACAEMLPELIQNVNAKLLEISPLERRFEQESSAIKQYQSVAQVAGISALLMLLYGLFFSIFVALYLYRSKSAPTCEKSTQEPENQNPEPQN